MSGNQRGFSFSRIHLEPESRKGHKIEDNENEISFRQKSKVPDVPFHRKQKFLPFSARYQQLSTFQVTVALMRKTAYI